MMQKKPVHRATQLDDAENELMEAEPIMAQLRNDDVFQTLSPHQTRQFHVVLNLLRDLIHDLEQGIAQERRAS
jgi:hypothetical protein